MDKRDKRKGWLKEIKPGDRVIICTESGENIRPIKRITPSGRIITIGLNRIEEDTFDSDGNIMGDTYFPRHLEQATEQRIRKINAEIFSRI